MRIGRAIQRNPVEAMLIAFIVFALAMTLNFAFENDRQPVKQDCPVDAVPIQDKSN